MNSELFKNKKILVMGLGLHGGGIAVAKWLFSHGARVTVTDLKTKDQLAASLAEFSPAEKKKIIFILGRHREADFKNNDLLIKNPGVPRDSKYLKITTAAGIRIFNDASLFFSFCPAKIIGVTGTRGKSTTSTLIAELLKAGLSDRSAAKIWLAGQSKNPELKILDQIKSKDLAVLELSSWQLEILGRHNVSPYVSVITNIYPDHLNSYSGMADYVAAKKKIIEYQNSDNFSVLNLDNVETRKIGWQVISQRFWFSKKYFADQNGSFVKSGKIFFRLNGVEKPIVNLADIKLVGEHNLENVLAAVTVGGIFKIAPGKIKAVLKRFSGLASRIEVKRVIKGVKYINDTAATTPDAAMAALKSLSDKPKNIILIAGGVDKNIPIEKYRELAGLIKKSCLAVILFKGDGSKQILQELQKISFTPVIFGIDSMVAAIGIANNLSTAGKNILLSPACASFGLFVNEFDRGDQFNEIVKHL